MPFRRVVWIVLDSVGIGAMQDAARYGDAGSDTLGNIARVRPLHLPNLTHLGLANIRPIEGLHPVASPLAAYGRSALASPGKDTTTGHWEMAGIILEKPFPLYPNGFPREVINKFEQRTGRQVLGNCAASGTEIIAKLGDEHVRTGAPIVYTSADSVFQVAAHEEVIRLEELYGICSIAREILSGKHEVGRVIARPFTGSSGRYTRTSNRKDFAVPPPAGMLLDRIAERKVTVHTVGKIGDVFLGRGITRSDKTKSNADGMQKTIEAMQSTGEGLLWVNLVDFDMLFGHRNDVEGYASALEEVDTWIPTLLAAAASSDLILFTADHGCDPTTPSTDHTREYVPILAYGLEPCSLGTRKTLADLGQTVAQIFGTTIQEGSSFLVANTNGNSVA